MAGVVVVNNVYSFKRLHKYVMVMVMVMVMVIVMVMVMVMVMAMVGHKSLGSL